jgi:hypothetical protein
MDDKLRDLLAEAKALVGKASDLLRKARERSPGDLLTRNAFLMSIKTYDLTIESLQRNASKPGVSQHKVESLYNSSCGDDED